MLENKTVFSSQTKSHLNTKVLLQLTDSVKTTLRTTRTKKDIQVFHTTFEINLTQFIETEH